MILDQTGLPAPHLQVSIFAPDGTFLGRTDLGYPELGVLLEFDGFVKYSKLLKDDETSVDVVVREKDRENLIRGMGYLVIRIVWADLSNPALLADRIIANLDRGRRIVANGGLAGTWRCRQAPAGQLILAGRGPALAGALSILRLARRPR